MGAQVSISSLACWSYLNAFTSQGVLDRYRQIQPKLVFAETEVVYAGKTIDLMPKITEVILDLQSHALGGAILFPSAKSGREPTIPSTLPNWYAENHEVLSGNSLLNISQFDSEGLPCYWRWPSFDLRAGSFQSPNVYSVFVRHDRRAQVYRALRWGEYAYCA